MILIPGIAFLGFIAIVILLSRINKKEVFDPKAEFIAKAIKKGAFTFLYEEYKIIFFVVMIVAAIINYFSSFIILVSFLVGAFLSLSVGFLGMYAATKANLKTTIEAKNKGEQSAFLIAFYGGGIMGFAVATVGLVGLTIFLFIALHYLDRFELILTAFGFGASLVAFFARVGGGIYTKSADVGADLVGKLEAGIPEDDPRNPAVIADNVGDCVGDTAGMGADIYESYIASMVSTIILGYYQFHGSLQYIMLPLIISGIGLAASLLSLIIIKFFTLSSRNFLRVISALSVGIFLIMSLYYILLEGMSIYYWYTIAIGCLAGLFIGSITEYYTGGKPIKMLAQNSESGAATNIIYGLSIGMESVVIPIIGLAGLVYIAFSFAEHYGVALSAVAMLGTVAITMNLIYQ